MRDQGQRDRINRLRAIYARSRTHLVAGNNALLFRHLWAARAGREFLRLREGHRAQGHRSDLDAAGSPGVGLLAALARGAGVAPRTAYEDMDLASVSDIKKKLRALAKECDAEGRTLTRTLVNERLVKPWKVQRHADRKRPFRRQRPLAGLEDAASDVEAGTAAWADRVRALLEPGAVPLLMTWDGVKDLTARSRAAFRAGLAACDALDAAAASATAAAASREHAA